MNITFNKDAGIYTLDRGTGTVDLTVNEVSLLVNQFMKNGLRESIEYRLHEADGDTIDLEKYPYSFEELIDEIYVDLEDEVDYGNYPDDDDIDNKIEEVASFYEMELD